MIVGKVCQNREKHAGASSFWREVRYHTVTIPHGHFVRVQGPTQPLTATSSTLTKRLVESLFLHPYLKLFHSTFVYVLQCEI